MSKKNIPGLTHHIGHFNSALDRLKLHFQSWIPTSGTFDKIIYIHHGFGDHSGRYFHLIEALHNEKTAFFALDARGHGKSEGKRGHVSDFSDFKKDLNQFIDMINQKHPTPTKILYGHSMGGAVCLDFAIDPKNQEKISALVSSSAAIRIQMDLVKHIKKFIGEKLAKLAPSFVVDAGLDVAGISHDPAAIQAYKKDPLVHSKISFSLGVTFFAIGQTLIDQANKIKIPTLVFHGTGDSLTDYTGSEAVYSKLGSPIKTLKLYPELYHEIINESPELRKKPLADIVEWIEEI